MHPVPSAEESLANATYEALMWALARPGMVRHLPQPGPGALVETLIDRECQVFCENDALRLRAERTGAALVELAQADHVFLDRLDDPATLTRLRQGSDLHPEDGATLVLPAELGTGTALRLTGPGVDGTIEIRVGGLPEGLWAMRAEVMRYPMGFEMFLIDGDRVAGLPRTTAVEVL